MTKDGLLKKAMGAAYTEREEDALTMDMGLLQRLAKQNLGAQYSEKEIDAFGNPKPEIDFEKLRQDFTNILGGITPQEQEQVINHWQRADDEGKTKFMQYVVANPPRATGYGIQNEVGY